MSFEVRWYQREAEEAIYTYFAHHKGNPVIALPTGTGKSVVIARFIYNVFMRYAGQVITVLTHRKELIEQNSSRLAKMWPAAPIGIYSAGVGKKVSHMPITFGGVQSVVQNLDLFMQHTHLVIIDECHLINPKDKGMYADVLRHMRKINPLLKVIGFTATDYRMKQGKLTEMVYDDLGIKTSLFTDVIYDLTGIEGWSRLIREGFLCKLVARATQTNVDISNVAITAGEFNMKQLAAKVDTQWVNTKIVEESIHLAADRHSWLVFGIDIEHCEHLATLFQERNFAIEAVHSKLSDKQNDARFDAFKRGELLGLSNNDKLTTGMDHAPLDCIVMARHTMSPSLHVQMFGRGTRPYDCNNPLQHIEGFEYVKHDCLALDFARNCERLGPINNPVLPKPPGQKKHPGDMPVKICPQCGVYNFAAARVCDNCGEQFPFNNHLETTSDAHAVFIDSGEDLIERIHVIHASYQRYQRNPGSTPMLRVQYLTDHKKHHTIIENIMVETHQSRKHVEKWWMQRHAMPCPLDINECLKFAGQLKTPRVITAITNRKYPEIQSVEF